MTQPITGPLDGAAAVRQEIVSHYNGHLDLLARIAEEATFSTFSQREGSVADASYYLGMAEACRFLLGQSVSRVENPRLFEIGQKFQARGGKASYSAGPITPTH
jgi:hypothetical protein